MEIITTIENIRSIVNHWKDKGYSIGFVPTMGYLHDGHAALIDQARKDNDKVIVSIFVNPTQFGENEDLNSYPRDINRDKSLCETHKADIIFSPTSDEMYHDRKAFVNIVELSDTLCGISRPIHFKGVCTVVAKLFNIIQPTNAYFGEKDAQQLAIIRKMVYDLNFPVNIIGVPIVRESDGLAKSSRNTYLSSEERKAATILYKAIQEGKQCIKRGASADSIINVMTNIVNTEPLAKIDYISVVDANTMQPVHEITSPVLVAMAVYIGSTRLIDNFSFDAN
ncbi:MULTISPECIES: pantoate--beta-alanine ligase [Veillonella]|uniref:pantoate--beta-alanine ligase n=1 Tax=Veillonella TaxID=29465 RepID=UPI0024915504|nr:MULTISPECIES: pantoate--beta-alanine ligase [Veillonella]MDU5941008.1 pantoate--beta-alanine ligase [Veillonella sp.]